MPSFGSQSRHDTPAFPFRQLAVLAICRIAEPIAFMSIFPYIYYMIESFHVTDNDKRIAMYAGMVTSAFALAEGMSSSLWGRLSDKFGRKPILLCGLAGTGISMLVFGFAQNLATALLARAMGGLLNGNIGVLQTTVAEVVQHESHQAVAFALMPTVWCVGAVLGSALGGGLADPATSYPGIFGGYSLLRQYPYLLPNLVCAVVVLVGMTIGILFLEETHEDMQSRKDYGLVTGKWLLAKLRLSSNDHESTENETYSLLSHDDLPPHYQSTASSPALTATPVALPPPYQPIEAAPESIDMAKVQQIDASLIEAADANDAAVKRTSAVRNALTTQVLLNIVGYGILAYHTISAEQLLPVLFSMPETDETPQLPFWFTGGFALPTKSIGGILSVQGVMQMVATLVFFPIVQRKLGTLTTYRLVVLTYPLLYIVVPYLTLVPVSMRMPAVYAILVWKVTAQAFAFPANNIMLANATPKRALGTFNGISASAASFARALGPTLSGLLQAAGLGRHVLGLPWWVNALIAIIGSVISLCMVEQKRNASDPEKQPPQEDWAPVPSTISPDINAALIANESSNASMDGTPSRPNSPLLVRQSVDVRRDSRRASMGFLLN